MKTTEPDSGKKDFDPVPIIEKKAVLGIIVIVVVAILLVFAIRFTLLK